MTTVRPTHWPMNPFPVIDDCLWIGGMPLTQLAARVGQIPFYAYDRRLLDERVALLRRTLPPAIELHYAVKANPMPAVVQHMANRVDGLDVASLGELKVALDTGMNPARISFADRENARRNSPPPSPPASRSIWNPLVNWKRWPGWAWKRVGVPRLRRGSIRISS